LPEPTLKCNGKMSGWSTNFYAEWRRRSGVLAALREDPAVPPEHLLQAVWFHQRLCRDRLKTLDGQRVHVLHPGFWNHEAGPDFREAMLQFEGGPPRSCDVEVDLHTSGWVAHRHHANPNFKRVALHVVWEGSADPQLPTLALPSFLDAPLDELALWLSSEAALSFPQALQGKCCAPLSELASDRLLELLRQAALVRLQSKAAQCQARARQAGWEQALWEGMFRALGYKHNVWPMQRLAELRARLCPAKTRPEPLVLQARLLGMGGLLPSELPKAPASTERYWRRLWDLWWREREAFADGLLPRALWRFSGLRPANHPQRRLALAAHWLAAGDLVSRLEKWGTSSWEAAEMVPAMLAALHVAGDDFWSWHWTLRAPRLAKIQPLIGATRVTDLAVNVILPWLWSRAAEGRNQALCRELERRYLAWPPAEDNALLRLARQRLLGASPVRLRRGAAAQQGLLQIVRDFCEHSNALCENCQFPEGVRQWQAECRS